jgi:hypothetical protein
MRLARQLGYKVAAKANTNAMMTTGPMSAHCGSLGMRLIR